MSHHLSNLYPGSGKSFAGTYVPQGLFRAQQKKAEIALPQHVVGKSVQGESRRQGEVIDRRGLGFGAHMRLQG